MLKIPDLKFLQPKSKFLLSSPEMKAKKSSRWRVEIANEPSDFGYLKLGFFFAVLIFSLYIEREPENIYPVLLLLQ
uniref:Putative ovule protein n=1 Tax=Solanum chacoense TaxID=4108 RepID=A0A0V0GIE1_SOLCH